MKLEMFKDDILKAFQNDVKIRTVMCKSSSIALGDENELKIKGLPVENCL